MSKNLRNKLSAAALGGTIFCALWLLVSAQAAVDHYNTYATHQQTEQDVKPTPTRTVRVLVPDTAN